MGIGSGDIGKGYSGTDQLHEGEGLTTNHNPLDLDGLQLWLDASDSSTITESGDDVSQWDDLSGGGNNATQSTGLDQPKTNTETINRLNAIDFDGTDHWMDGTALDVSTGVFSISIVFEPDSVTGTQGVFAIFKGTGDSRIRFETSGALVLVAAASSSGDLAARQTGSILVVDTPLLATAVYDGGLDHTNIKIYIDGVRQDNAGVNVGSFTGVTASTELYEVGARQGGILLLIGSIGEVIVTNTTWDDTIRQRVEQRLMSRWGL